MTDKLHEQVSTLIDDELPTREAELLLARLERDPAMRERLGRYALVGEAMRGSLSKTYDPNFATRVAESIERENIEPRRNSALARLRPIAGLAVAASVAMLAVMTLQAPQVEPPSEVVPDMRLNGNAPLLNVQRVDFSGVRSPELQNQLRSYLLNHSEHSNNVRLRGVMPYVQIAAHDTRPVEGETEEATREDREEPRR